MVYHMQYVCQPALPVQSPPFAGPVRTRARHAAHHKEPMGFDDIARLAPVAAPLLIDETARVLRELIVDGTIAPGSRLSERQLGEKLGVSRTPLREALRLLAGEQLVDLSPRRGASVTKLDPETIEHVFRVLDSLERLAIELACVAMDDEAIAGVSDLHDRMRRYYEKRDKRRFFAINQEFHEAILRGSGNPVLERTYRGLSGQVRRARYMSLNTEEEWASAVREHERIVDALVKRDVAKASRALSAHIEAKKKKVLRQLARERRAPDSA